LVVFFLGLCFLHMNKQVSNLKQMKLELNKFVSFLFLVPLRRHLGAIFPNSQLLTIRAFEVAMNNFFLSFSFELGFFELPPTSRHPLILFFRCHPTDLLLIGAPTFGAMETCGQKLRSTRCSTLLP
jgi:hypothetical protein